MPPVRDEEHEIQRKAHAKRVRETRRSTQGDDDDDDVDDGLYGRIFTMAMGPYIRSEEAKFYPRPYYNLEEIV